MADVALMKGHVWYKRKHKVKYPVMVEDKHDEIRCRVIVSLLDVTYESYAGKPLANMQQFDLMFITLARGTGYHEFDMGFEVNANFNDSYRWVRSTKGAPLDLINAPKRFFIFGLPEFAGKDTLREQYLRRHEVADYAANWVSTPVDVPHCVYALCEEDVERAFNTARAHGLEGVMVKQGAMLYERKRTEAWLKMKPEDTEDGVLVGVNQAIAEDGTPHDRAGSVNVRMPDGSVASPAGIAWELGADLWKNPEKYVGQWVEFSYMERDRQGGYRHPVFRRFREDK